MCTCIAARLRFLYLDRFRNTAQLFSENTSNIMKLNIKLPNILRFKAAKYLLLIVSVSVNKA